MRMDIKTLERVRLSLDGQDIGPETIALMLTKACNLNCLYCRGGRARPETKPQKESEDELSVQDLSSLFEDAKRLKVKEINLGGMDGEPFCKKDILSIMRLIKQLGFFASMTTNGSFLNSEIAGILTRWKWDILLLSFDSCEPYIQETVRPAANGAPYFNNIIQFLETLNTIDSSLRVLLNVVISRHNYKKLPELIAFANSYKNIESVNILRLLNTQLVHYDDLRLNAEQCNEFKSILNAFKDEKKMKYHDNWISQEKLSESSGSQMGNTLDALKENSLGKCFTNYYILSINSNGDIIKCPQYQESLYGLNIKRVSLKKLWKNEHLQVRQSLAKHATCFEGCCTILKEQNLLVYKDLISHECRI